MKVRFWGVRGGLPVPGPRTVRVGGNTPCVELRSSEGDLIILDAGTGLHELGRALSPEQPHRVVATILISHAAADHVEGLPFFAPARGRGNRFVIVGPLGSAPAIQSILANRQVDVYFPAMPEEMHADVLVKELKESEPIVVGRSVVVRARRVHPDRDVLGFRISADGCSVAYITDVRHPDGSPAPAILEIARRADLLIHDAQLTPEDRHLYPDWAHSSWDEAIKIAQQVGARQLALFHHSPDASDETLSRVERLAQSAFSGALLAREGLELDLTTAPAAAGEARETPDEGDTTDDEKLALSKAARRIVRKLKND